MKCMLLTIRKYIKTWIEDIVTDIFILYFARRLSNDDWKRVLKL